MPESNTRPAQLLVTSLIRSLLIESRIAAMSCTTSWSFEVTVAIDAHSTTWWAGDAGVRGAAAEQARHPERREEQRPARRTGVAGEASLETQQVVVPLSPPQQDVPVDEKVVPA